MTWQTKKLIEICTEITDGSHFSPKSSTNGAYPYITVKDIENDSINFENCKFIDKYSYEELLKNGCQPNLGDLLFSKDGTVGKVSLVNFEKDFVVLSSLAIIRPNHKIIDSLFLKYILKSPKFLNIAIGHKTGVAIKRIILRNLKDINITFPGSLEEQKRIVKILDEVFEKIQKAKENTEKNLQNSRELFESYSRNVFKNPGNWNNKTLGEVCNLYQGIAINAKTRHALVVKSDLPLLRIKDLKNNTVEQYIDPNNFPKNALVNESDLIYTRTGQIGLVFTSRRGVLHNNSFKIVPNETLNRRFLFYWLQNPIFKEKIISLASRVAQPDITHVLFKRQTISIPILKEQNIIFKKLDELSEKTKKLEEIYKQKLADLEELKKSVLSKAFAGEL